MKDSKISYRHLENVSPIVLMESTGAPWASWAIMKDVSPDKNIMNIKIESEQNVVPSDFTTSILETSECIEEHISMHDRLLVKKTPMIYQKYFVGQKLGNIKL